MKPEQVFENKFQTPEEEINYLRKELEKKESNLEKNEVSPETRESLTTEVIKKYQESKPEDVIAPHQQIPKEEIKGITLKLSPEEHDDQIASLFHLMNERGLKNVFLVLDNMNNPHLEDDWHRFLVQYLLEGYEIKKTNNKELLSELTHTLFEITIPQSTLDANQKDHRQLTAITEQLLQGIQPITEEGHAISFEIALDNNHKEIIFYVSVPKQKADNFEKLLVGLYPYAKVNINTNDFNIFNPDGYHSGVFATTGEHESLPIKTYEEFEVDTINVMLNAFTKLKDKGEGAAIQVVIGKRNPDSIKKYQTILKELNKGTSLKSSVKTAEKSSIFGGVLKELFGLDSKEESSSSETSSDSDKTQYIQKKISSHLRNTNIRIVASADTEARADEIVHDLAATFHQFSIPGSNHFVFKPLKTKHAKNLIKDFIYRRYNKTQNLILSEKEIASIIHFPLSKESGSQSQLKQAKAATAPAPIEMEESGIILGTNSHRGEEKPVYFTDEDRVRHFYVIGQTGTGKTGIMMSMIAQDIQSGKGVAYIDPHGTDIQTILSFIPKERYGDVIYFDPAHTARPMGLNMLEYDPTYPEQKTLIIDELMGIFNQLFDMKAQGGAMFQQYFKNSAFLVMDHPESGNTLLEITRVLGDPEFRKMKLSHCKNPIVRQFWENAEQTTGDQSLANFVPYISSKFDPLISNEIMRPVVVQEKSAFNVRNIMDEGKILLVNLSKGRLGELNAALIGLILVGKIQMAALSRVDSYGKDLKPFYLYIDEFQNIVTPSISSILSEARKYKLSLNIAHQYLSQLNDDIKNAVLGNVGSMAIFRISPEDAKQLEPRVSPTFEQKDIIKLDNRNAYLSMLVNGQPARPFNMSTTDFNQFKQTTDPNSLNHLKELSYQKYGRDRSEVESEIMQRYEESA